MVGGVGGSGGGETEILCSTMRMCLPQNALYKFLSVMMIIIIEKEKKKEK